MKWKLFEQVSMNIGQMGIVNINEAGHWFASGANVCVCAANCKGEPRERSQPSGAQFKCFRQQTPPFFLAPIHNVNCV